MSNAYVPATFNELKSRVEKLTPDSPRQWGKMDVAQMMAHCSNSLEVTLGDVKTKQAFLGKIFGKIAKKSITGNEPIKPGLPTAPAFLINQSADFGKEKQRLLGLIGRLSAIDPAVMEQNIHPFFGKLTREEWNTMNSKHLDHHLRQFGA